jgi:hypothetical protein
MTKLEIFKPDSKFIDALALDLREGDKREIAATSGRTPHQALIHAMSVSDLCWGATLDEVPAGMWGVRTLSILGGLGVPWFLSGNVINKYPIKFYKVSQDMLTIMHEKYPVLVQAIDFRYKEAIEWAERIGFKKVGAPMITGVQGKLFQYVTSRRG